MDKAALEKYLRHIELFRGEVNFKIDDPKPSKALPGFSEVAVHLSYDGGARDYLYYVSADGKTIVKGDVYSMNQSPFQTNLDKLTTADQPSLGPSNAPVTIVEFGDLQCPDCKMEAPVLHHEVPQAFPDKVRVVFKDFPLESIHPWARAAAIADRRTGVGCDQFIAIEPPPDNSGADAFMRIRNPDGAEAGACGNATRCVPICWRARPAGAPR